MLKLSNPISEDELKAEIVRDLEDEEALNTPKRKRQRLKRIPLSESIWGRMLNDPSIADENSFTSKKFRRRFRVPYKLFADILVPICRDANIFSMQNHSYMSIEFKILIALRVLGRDAKADDINELINIGESTATYIFKTFVTEFSKVFMSTFVKFPEQEELLDIMETYRMLGFPGAIGSVDCTHVRLNRCPNNLKWLCTGKEAYPSLSFLVIVNHFRQVLHVGNACFGASNDMTISRNDPKITEF